MGRHEFFLVGPRFYSVKENSFFLSCFCGCCYLTFSDDALVLITCNHYVNGNKYRQLSFIILITKKKCYVLSPCYYFKETSSAGRILTKDSKIQHIPEFARQIRNYVSVLFFLIIFMLNLHKTQTSQDA